MRCWTEFQQGNYEQEGPALLTSQEGSGPALWFRIRLPGIFKGWLSFVHVCVTYLCREFHLPIRTVESQKGLFTRGWACSAGFSVCVLHARLCYMMTCHRTWKPYVGQVLGRPPEPPLISVTKASLLRVLCRYLVDVLFFLTSLRIRNEYVYDAFTI